MKKILIIFLLLFNTSCIMISDLTSDGPKIKDVAATLDSIPIGTSFEAIKNNYFETVQFYETFRTVKAVGVAIDMKSLCDDISYNTYGKPFEDTYNFFRMHPIDLFLNLEEGDLYISPSFIEGNYNRADLYIFFTKDKKYKGYYGYGLGSIKGGGYTYKKLRGIEAELINAGYGKICDYGKGKWEGWQELNSSLQLPLKQHLDK